MQILEATTSSFDVILLFAKKLAKFYRQIVPPRGRKKACLFWGERKGKRRRRGKEREEGGVVTPYASREKGYTVVGPLYRDPRPAAQLLISSAAHQSLVHDHRLVKSRPPYRRNLASRAISRRGERGMFVSFVPTFLRTLRRLNQRAPKCIAKRSPSPPSVSFRVPPPSLLLFHRCLRFCFSPLVSSPFFLFVYTSSYIRFRALIFLWAGDIFGDKESKNLALS